MEYKAVNTFTITTGELHTLSIKTQDRLIGGLVIT